MCAVKLSEQEIFVIGGYPGPRNEVWIYDPQNGFARTQGPSLNTGRGYHSCSTMKDGEKIVIIAAGGWNYFYHLDSVEIYDPTDNTWYSGKSNSLLESLKVFRLKAAILGLRFVKSMIFNYGNPREPKGT